MLMVREVWMEDEMYWELEFLCALFFSFMYDSLYNCLYIFNPLGISVVK